MRYCHHFGLDITCTLPLAQIIWTYILSQAAAGGDEEPVAIESAGGGGEIDESVDHRLARKARALEWGKSH